MCNCRSYNLPEPHQTDPEVVLDAPAWAQQERRTITVDPCIAPVILALWDARIWTIGCCCGHGDQSKRNVIVDRTNRMAAEKVIAEIGDKAGVLAWELV